MIDDYIKPEGNDEAAQPLPTGTFRKQESDDGMADLDFGEPTQKTGGFGTLNKTGGGAGSFLSGGKGRHNEDDDFENILDDLEEKKGVKNQRPKTAAENFGFKDNAWGGEHDNFGQHNRNNSKFNIQDDLDELDAFGNADDDDDDVDLGLVENRKQFSSGKGMAHQRSNDQIFERKKTLFGAGSVANP